ncbi:hypothetical protein [Nonomuraea sp. NPDC050310]|uniref:hypothetical protein n=1 Tax=Nonomuraea sp. NPDC050310 TaxID=3154935 RepID=UPI0033F96734
MSNAGFRRGLILAVDAKGYGSGTDQRHEAIQAGLIKVLTEAAAGAGLDREAWARQGSGDGELAILPPHEHEPAVLDDFVHKLATALRRHNADLRDEARLRLRLAVHHGASMPSANGFAGQAVVTACRLADSDAARAALASAPEADLVLVLSERVFEDTVRQGHTAHEPDDFTPALARTKEGEEIAWIRVLGRRASRHHLDEGKKNVNSTIAETAETLWPIIAAGGLERVGAYGTEGMVAATKSLLDRLRAFRKRRGEQEDPASREELVESLELLTEADADAEPLLQRFVAEKIVVQNFRGPVFAENAVFGFKN